MGGGVVLSDEEKKKNEKKNETFSYWFVYFEASYEESESFSVRLRGNSVHKLPGKFFLPSTVQEAIRKALHENSEIVFSIDSCSYVYLVSVLQIEEEGVKDWENDRTVFHAFTYCVTETEIKQL